MLRHIESSKMGRSFHGWLDSHFHFSFAEYHNPENINFGVLRVINDDLVKPGTGFDMHSHQNMEILSYVIDGQLTHADSMKNKQTLTRGQVQYMSAGTGVVHSEHNLGQDILRFLQIWILPGRSGYPPAYGDFRFVLDDRNDTWLAIATWTENKESHAPIRILADVNVFASIISKGNSLDFSVKTGRQAYMVLIEGEAQVADVHMGMRDGLEVIEQDISVASKADTPAHVLIIEMAKS